MRSRADQGDGHYVLTREQQREALEGARALLRTMEEREAEQDAAEKVEAAGRR